MSQEVEMGTNARLHLSSPGPYRDAIEGLTKKYPNLRDRDYSVYANDRRYASAPRIACFDFTDPQNMVTTNFPNTAAAKGFITQNSISHQATGPARRLFLLEGLDPDSVSLFGNVLQIDPVWFMRHQRTSVRERSSNQPGNTPKLASMLEPKKEFIFEYPELRCFQLKAPTFATRCAENGRNLSLSRQNGKFDHIGVLQRKLSFWSQETAQKGWTAMMVVDEPLRQVVAESKHETQILRVVSEPYEGGYPDIIKYSTLSDAVAAEAPPRTSMYNDICHYFQHHAGVLHITQDARSVTTFAQKIVASHFVLLAQYMFNHLSYFEWQLGRRQTFADLHIAWVEERWSDLWTLHTRLNNHRRNVDVVLDTLEPGDPNKWTNTRKDFKSIELRLLQLKVKSDALINSFVGLASIVNSRQSFLEARTVRFLTILGMVFLPLSFVSGLFSMAGSFSPGGAQFWIYFVVAFPLTLLISSIGTFFAPRYVERSEHLSSHPIRHVTKASMFSKLTNTRQSFQEV